MKIYVFIAFIALFALTSGFILEEDHRKHVSLLGAKECTWGPSYWCQNLTNAAGCNAVKHCIQTVWIHQQLPPDTTSVCQTCLDMVKQARDQLLSNETQELIKQVIDGSCALLHVKIIVNECDKISDHIPDFIDTLASEMDPQVVCSVAGLCNNERIHRMLVEAGEPVNVEIRKPNACEGCHTVIDIVEGKFNAMSKDEILQGFLEVCGLLGSFSDGCSNIVVVYFNEIYQHLQLNLNANEVCLMSGECSAQFHQHAKVEITPISHIGYVQVGDSKDDLPCELCEQLVVHLKDLLITNTTEDEFKMVLTGICKQTNQFAQECVDLVDQYYEVAYDFLTHELNSTVLCDMIGICNTTRKQEGTLIAPLLPAKTAEMELLITPATNRPLVRVGLTKDTSSVKILSPAEQQLPRDILMLPHTQVLYNTEICIFCEYFLHYVQQAITNPKTEEQIKDVIDKACTKLPYTINATCIEFVNSYEPALVAILAQEIDPSQVCPRIKACPSSKQDVEIFMTAKSDPKCPLCLYAVTKLEQMVKNKKTEESIKSALNQLCIHLSSNLKEECQDFVTTYTNELVELLIADLKPEEVCVYLKLCTDDRPGSTLPPYVNNKVLGGDIETNLIPDNTINGKQIGMTDSDVSTNPQCIICEFIMKEIEDQLKNKQTDDEIKNIVYDICNIMPKTVKTDCNNFVQQYADTVIQLLIATLEPSEICSMIKLCTSKIEAVRVEILNCPLCELTVQAMKKILSNPKVDHDIVHVLEKTCRGIPKHYRSKCTQMIDRHGAELFNLIIHQQSPHHICIDIALCSEINGDHLVGTDDCTYGPSYWCESEENADKCSARTHCENHFWGAKRPKRGTTLVGANKCILGPGYWCQSEATADECGAGARTHCEAKVWGAKRPKRSMNLVGANKCTWGPGYWCQSEATADECGAGAKTHCEAKVWGAKRSKRSRTLVGANKCTQGPGYWCQSEATANECGAGARTHCEAKVWGAKRPKRSTPPVGANNCTWGPGYWCQSEATAEECGAGARTHCETEVWKTKRSTQNGVVVGANNCSRGPGYWCQSKETADECGAGATKHCETKVWFTAELHPE